MKIDFEKITWLRIEKGLSLTSLGEISGLSKSTMTRLSKKENILRPDTIGKIANALGVNPRELYIPD